MKKAILALSLLVAISGAVSAQSTPKAEKKDKKMEMKKHVCTDACKNGNHMYAHGEKGHTCTDACKKKM